ncbi:MAG: hypothetical protein JWN50_506 [Parcubacteria group bacterium]|nr:hypothetical protein [Parcubacteria group bacterium]
MTPEKQKLLELEKTGQYVFHGSGSEVEEFEPRQAHNHVNGEQIPDGEPAVFAASVVEYAIFMAIINKKNCPKGYRASSGSFGVKDGAAVMRYRATADTLSQLKDDASGWVYIFDKSLFSLRDEGGVEYISTKNVVPLEKVEVKKTDLPSRIGVLE